MPVPTSAAPRKASPQRPDDVLASVEELPSASRGGLRVFAEPNPAFHLAHAPDAWDVAEIEGEVEGIKLKGSYVLPMLSFRADVPGSTPGMRTRRDGEADEASYADAIRRWRDGGWTVLDRGRRIASAYLPPGVAEGIYVRRLACRSAQGQDGYHHFEAWNVPVRGPPASPQRFRFDLESYNRWRASLVLTGAVPEPTEFALEGVRREAEGRTRRIELTNWASPELRRARLDAARATLAVVQAAKLPTVT